MGSCLLASVDGLGVETLQRAPVAEADGAAGRQKPDQAAARELGERARYGLDGEAEMVSRLRSGDDMILSRKAGSSWISAAKRLRR